MTERLFGFFRAGSLSNGSLQAPYYGSTENVRFCYYLRRTTPDRLGLSQRALGKASSGSFFLRLLPIATYSLLVPPSSRTLWLNAKLDQPSWPISTSTSRTSENKPVATCCFHLYPSFLLALILAVLFSTVFTRHMTTAHDSQVTTL